MMTTICKTCNKEFTHKDWEKRVYCSRECHYKDPTFLQSANEARRGSKHREESRAKMRESRKKQTNVSNQFIVTGVIQKTLLLCRNCQQPSIISNSEIKRGGGKYCSRECYAESVTNKLRDTNRSIYRMRTWKKKREEIYKRDNYECQECGTETTRTTGKQKICCHHIDYDARNFDNNNLITLCSSCHGKTNHDRAFWIARFSTERTYLVLQCSSI